MFEPLQQIIQASKQRVAVRERVQRQWSIPANAQVHVREQFVDSSVQTIITVIEPESIRSYRILKAPGAITAADLLTPLAH